MPQGETTIFTGAGSQTGGLTRWGDYSEMSVDPADDCTFWYVNEYLPANGSFNWHTRIGSFKFPSCGAGSAPVVTTGSSSGVGTTTATVSGTVNPNGQSTTYHFDYGTSTKYGSQSPAPPDPSAGSGTTSQNESTGLSALSPGTTYHYRVEATNASATTYGSDQMFTTSTCSPRTSTYSGAVLGTSGVQAYWRLGESSGNVACDSKGSDNGTYHGGFTLGQPGALAGDPDTSVSFDGAAGSDAVAGVPSGLGATNASVEAWAYVPGSSAKGAFVMVGNGSNGYGIGVGNGTFDGAGSHLVVLFEEVRWIDTGANLTPGWHYVVLTLDASGSPTVYLDGTQVYSDTRTGPTAPTGGVYIGGYTAADSNQRYFAGRLDEVAVYNAALTSAQVANHYTTGGGSGSTCSPRTSTYSGAVLGTSGVQAYWRLGESSGNVACDSKGSDNGTYHGGFTLGQPGALAGDPDTSVSFDGAAGSDAVAGVPSGLGATNASVEAWAYVPGSSAKGAFVMVGNGSNGYGIGVGNGTFDGAGSHLVVLFEEVRWIDTGANLTPGWHYVVLTLDASGSPTVYLDGTQVYSDTRTGPTAPTGGVYIGGYRPPIPTSVISPGGSTRWRFTTPRLLRRRSPTTTRPAVAAAQRVRLGRRRIAVLCWGLLGCRRIGGSGSRRGMWRVIQRVLIMGPITVDLPWGSRVRWRAIRILRLVSTERRVRMRLRVCRVGWAQRTRRSRLGLTCREVLLRARS